MNLVMFSGFSGFPTRSDKNQAVQPQIDLRLEISDLGSRGIIVVSTCMY